MAAVWRLALGVALLLGCTPAPAPRPTEHAPAASQPSAVASATVGAASAVPEATTDSAATAPVLDASAAPVTLFEPAPFEGDVPDLGSFEEAKLPRKKHQLLMVVDEALRSGDATLLGRVQVDEATLRKRCPVAASKAAENRVAAARAFAACSAFADWPHAERLALRDDATVGRPPKSCGFGKLGAKLDYVVDGAVVEVSVTAFTYDGRFAITIPIRCRRPYGYQGTAKVPLGPDAWLKGIVADGARSFECKGLPWPHVFGKDGTVGAVPKLKRVKYRCLTP